MVFCKRDDDGPLIVVSTKKSSQSWTPSEKLSGSVHVFFNLLLIFYVKFILFQIKHDLVAFIRMFMIFMIAGGVTIQAVLYPNWPLNVDMIKRVLTRPIYAMFLTQVHDLDGGYNSKTVLL